MATYYSGFPDADPKERFQFWLEHPPSVIVLDVETVSLDEKHPLGFGLAVGPDEAFYFDLQEPDEAKLKAITPWLQDIRIRKLAHNWMFDMAVFPLIPLVGSALNRANIWDTNVAARLLGYQETALPMLALELFQEQISSAKDLLHKYSASTMAEVPRAEVAEHCLSDVKMCYRLYLQWKEQIEKEYPEYFYIEMQVIPILIDMSMRGIAIDQKARKELVDKYQTDIDFYRMVVQGYGIENPGSSQQVGYMLGKRGNFLPLTRSKRQLATDEANLEFLDDPLAAAVLGYRHATKFKSTYLDPLEGLDRLYTEYYMDTVVGRLNSRNRNIQNIPLDARYMMLPDSGVFTTGDYCLAPDTRVLSTELKWVKLKDVNIGDRLIGIDESPEFGKGKRRKLRTSTVTRRAQVSRQSKRITTTDGRFVIASNEHPWLVLSSNIYMHPTWVTTDRLKPGSRIRQIGKVWDTDTSYEAGWLAGFLDGEGWIDVNYHMVGFAQNNNTCLDYAIFLLEDMGYEPKMPRGSSSTAVQVRISNQADMLRLIGSVRPRRLLEKSNALWEGYEPPKKDAWVEVLSVEDVGEQELISIETSTHTFIAEGLVTHNSQEHLYILAQASQDRDMLKVMYHPDKKKRDIHLYTAERMSVPRKLAKTLNYCVPTSTEILTPDGWKKHHQLVSGNKVLGYSPELESLVWTEVISVLEPQRSELLMLGNQQTQLVATAAHRWYGKLRHHYHNRPDRYTSEIRTTEQVRHEFSITLASRLIDRNQIYDIPRSSISPIEAMIIAWLYTDGHIDIDRSNASIAQSKQDNIELIRSLLLSFPHTEYLPRDNGVIVWGLSFPHVRALLKKSMLYPKGNLHDFVLGLSDISRTSFLTTAILAEGYRSSNGQTIVTQNQGEVLEAIKLAAFLEGYFPRQWPKGDSRCYDVGLSKPVLTGQRLITAPLGQDYVWCLQTGLGNWVAKDAQGQIFITGNAVVYGATAKVVSEQAKIKDTRRCQRLIEDWFHTYKGAADWIHYAQEEGLRTGWALPTLFKRRIKLPLENDDAMRRKAVNYPILGCIPGDNRILVKNKGYIRIQDAGSEEQVWDGEQYAAASIRYSGQKQRVIITLGNSQQLECSPEHRVLVENSRRNRLWKTPGEIKSQDNLCLTRDTETASAEVYIPDEPLTTHWKAPHDIGNTRKLSFAMIRDAKALGIVLGRLASDGSYQVKGRQLRWLVADHEKDVLPILQDILQVFPIKTKVSNRPHTFHGYTSTMPMHYIDLYSVQLAKQAEHMGIGRRIPEAAWGNKELLRGFLSGLFDGDGGMSGSAAVLTIGNPGVSTQYPEEVQQALLLFGIRSTVRRFHSANYIAHIRVRAKDTDRFQQRIGFLSQHKQTQLVCYPRTAREGRGTERIRRVVFTGDMVDMWDVVDSGSGQFMTEGYITHNSDGEVIKRAILLCHKRGLGPPVMAITVHDSITWDGDIADRIPVQELENIPGYELPFKVNTPTFRWE